MEEQQRVRGSARATLVDAARQMLAGARFADLAAFVTVRSLTDRTGLSNGAVYSAFRSGPASASELTAPTAAARAALREALARPRAEVVEGRLPARSPAADGGGSSGGGSSDPLPSMGELTAAAVEDWALGPLAEEFSLVLLATMVAPGDPGVRAELWERHVRQVRLDARLVEGLLAVQGRRCAAGTAEDLAAVLICLVDGLALRARAEGRVDADLVGRAVGGLLEALTVPLDGPGGPVERAAPSLPPLDDAESAAVSRVVHRRYDAGGWHAVDHATVAAATGLDPARLAAHYPDRDAFARHVWARLAANVVRMAATVRRLPPTGQASWLVHELAGQVHGHRAATLALVVDEQRRARHGLPGDSWSEALLPVVVLLAEVLDRDRPAFGLAAGPRQVGRLDRTAALAQFVVGSVLLVSLTQPGLEPGDAADFVLATCLRA